MTALAAAAHWLRAHAFSRSIPGTATRVGAEAEWIPVDAVTGRPAPIRTTDGRGTADAMRCLAAARGWTERRSPKSGASEFLSANGDRLSFEPGGQIEYAAAPSTSVGVLNANLRAVADDVADACRRFGYDLCAMGIDPRTPVEETALQLDAERYRRMDAHFARIGPDGGGARMMRQTASLQITLDTGERPDERWHLLQALAPYIAAIFANAPRRDGVDTGRASVRRAVWDALDPSRTGLVIGQPGDDPATAYARFALGADAFLLGNSDDRARPLAAWGPCAAPGSAAWAEHLTTLFPEVRPRGYFEVRTCDALPAEWYAAPLVFVTGLAYHAPAARAAAGLLRVGEVSPDPALLARASQCGMRDAAMRDVAGDLWALALTGAAALGPTVVDEPTLESARTFVHRFTARGRTPADEVVAEPAPS